MTFKTIKFLCLLIMLSSPFASVRAAGTIVVLGDSLSAAYGIAVEDGWVALLEARLEQRATGWQVVNASISGDTSRGGLQRLPRLLRRESPAILILELGGNDGLRGLGLDETRDNLAAAAGLAMTEGASVVLAGMRLPPNYGPVYTQGFADLYTELADELALIRVPFLLEGVAGDPQLMQDDGLHPRSEAQSRILENVWLHLRPLLGAGGSVAITEPNQ